MSLQLSLGLEIISPGDTEPLNLLVVGQSIADLAFDDSTFIDNDAGSTALQAQLETYFPEVTLVNGAESGYAVRAANDGGFGSYLNASDTKSTTFASTVTNKVTAAGLTAGDINYIAICIGNTDAAGMNAGSSTLAETQASYEALVAILKSDYPSARIGLIPLGGDRNSQEWTGYRNMGFLETALFAADTVDRLPSYVFSTFRDDLHLDQAGAESFWPLVADRIAALKGKRALTGTLGPLVTGMSIDSTNNQVYLDISGDNAVDTSVLTGTGGGDYIIDEAMFTFDVNGVLRNTQWAVYEPDTQRVRCRINGHVVNGSETLLVHVLCTTMRGVSIPGAAIIDTAGLPLQKESDVPLG